MDPTRWHLWHTPGGEWVAQLKGSNGRVRHYAATAQERAEWCDAWEREHPEAAK